MNLVVCIPQWGMPDYVERAAAANGDKPEDYSLMPCPDCREQMWIGPRVRPFIESGMKYTCALCAILVHKISKTDVVGMKVMTREMERES